MSSPQPPRAAAAPSPVPTQASEAASLTVDSAVLTGPLRDLTTATTTLATSLGNQATQISHQMELVDRALLEGLEKLAVKSEDTNITLSRLLASTEHLLERGNAHVLQAGLNINTGIATFTEASERDADFQAAQTLAERMGQGAREQMAADVTLISGDLAMMNRNVREVRDLQTRLFADAAGGYDWLSPPVRAVYHWVCDMGLPFWIALAMFCFMVSLKYKEMEDRLNAVGVSETTAPFGAALAMNVGWKDVLQDPKPFLEYFFKGKK